MSFSEEKIIDEEEKKKNNEKKSLSSFDFEIFKSKIEKSYKQIAISRKMRKYYRRRYQLFNRFDDGILMDLEGWYSVTPETISQHIAYELFRKVNFDSTLTVLDAFCGCAGNTFQLAIYFDCVLASDIEFTKLTCAQHNVQHVYYKNSSGVGGSNQRSIVQFVMQDFFSLHKTLRIDQEEDQEDQINKYPDPENQINENQEDQSNKNQDPDQADTEDQMNENPDQDQENQNKENQDPDPETKIIEKPDPDQADQINKDTDQVV